MHPRVSRGSAGPNVLGLGTLLALGNVELDLLALVIKAFISK